MLNRLLRDRITVVWLGLIVATLTSWLLGVGHELPVRYAAIGIIVIAFAKVSFVGRYFMEIRLAPTVLVSILSAWTVVVAVALIGLYLFA
jgi:hypothetical protein